MTDDPQPIAMIPLWDEGPLDDPGNYCCIFMQQQLSTGEGGVAAKCRNKETHATNTVQCPDQVIVYSAKDDSYYLSPLGPSPLYIISYCPSCGKKLPGKN